MLCFDMLNRIPLLYLVSKASIQFENDALTNSHHFQIVLLYKIYSIININMQESRHP